MVSCLLIGEIHKKQKLFYVNFTKTPIQSGQKMEYSGLTFGLTENIFRN